jgi:hypothetical protein
MRARHWSWRLAMTMAAASPGVLAAQAPTGPAPAVRLRADGFDLGQSDPNPTAGDTRLPFFVGDPPTCRDARRRYRVSLRIYNLLAQEVAVPVLLGPNGESEGARRLENVELNCRQYTAFWDGRVQGTQNPAPEGMYLYRLVVNGRAVVRKLIVRR